MSESQHGDQPGRPGDQVPGGPSQPPPYGGYPPGNYPPAGGPQYPYGSFPPPRKRHRVRNVFIGLGAFVVLIVVISVVATAARGPKTTKLSSLATTSGAASAPSAASKSPTTSAPLTASVGGTFKITDADGNVYDVTLLKVIDPAQGSDEFNQPDNGKRFVAAVFRITGVSGTASDDANTDATVTGADQQVYQPDFDTIAGYTNFNAGDFNVQQSQSETGAVTFQVPIGVKVANVQWTVGFNSSVATWTVG